jgi:hypothetical protein
MTKHKERYVLLRHWLLKSPAWRSLPVGARALYIELALRYNGSNNGRIPYSLREAVEALHISKETARHLFRILRERGFIVCTRKGAFSLKTTKDASEWRLTEYDSDTPVAHATKEFMRWQLPEDIDLDTLNRQPSHHRKSETRVPQPDRTGTPARPHGYPSKTVNCKKRQNGYPSQTVRAKNASSTGTPAGHLQLPGIGSGPGAADRCDVSVPDGGRPPEGETAPKKPWSAPMVTEIPWDTLPVELRMLALGLPVPVIEPKPVPGIRPEDLPF